MESRTTTGLFLVVLVALLVGSLAGACHGGQPTVDYAAIYYLEIANDAAEYAVVRVFLGGSFKDLATGVRGPSGSGSGIISLRSDERRTFEVSVFGPRDSAEDNNLVSSFGRIEFFEENLDTPYRGYYYPIGGGCGDVPPGSDCSDDLRIYRRDPDGTEERLFVESPDRPFYLERDKEDPELGRIVITFVPSTVAGSGHVVN